MLASYKSAVASKVTRSSVKAQALGSYLPGSTKPAYLAGLPGDFGFDPLGLGKDAEALRWYQQAELVHGRTAMTAVAGILIPGALTSIGVLNVPQWFAAGDAYLARTGSAEWGAGPIPVNTLVAISFFMTHFVEVKRWQDFRKPKSQAEPGSFFGLEASLEGQSNGYPGGAFDPLGLSKGTKEALDDYKLKEIKNGRLAMVAFAGFVGQYYATGKGPIDNLAAHIADPGHVNFTTNGLSIPFF